LGGRKYERRAEQSGKCQKRGAGEDGAEQGAAVHAAVAALVAHELPVRGFYDEDRGFVGVRRVALFVAQRVDGRHLGSKSVVCCVLVFGLTLASEELLCTRVLVVVLGFA
jgi:hypothetical protein